MKALTRKVEFLIEKSKPIVIEYAHRWKKNKQ